MTPNDLPQRTPKSFWITAVLFTAFFATTIFASWPSNVIDSNTSSQWRRAFIASFQQGWPFFTKPPQDPELTVYSVGGETLLLTPQTRAENLWGVSRTQRAQGPELAILADQATNWTDCNKRLSECLAAARELPPAPTVNRARYQTTCGDVVLMLETTTPWSYRDFANADERMVTRFSHLSVTCEPLS